MDSGFGSDLFSRRFEEIKEKISDEPPKEAAVVKVHKRLNTDQAPKGGVDSTTEAQSGSELELESEPEQPPKLEPEPQTDPRPEPEPQTDPRPEPESQPESGTGQQQELEPERPEPRVGKYTVTGDAALPPTVYETAELSSNLIGKLQLGDVINVVETVTKDGKVWIRFDWGWTIFTYSDGSVAFEEADGDAAISGMQYKSEGVLYEVVAEAKVRTGSGKQSAEKLDKKLKVGRGILVLESVKLEDGTVRHRFKEGWTSQNSASGNVLLERIEGQKGVLYRVVNKSGVPVQKNSAPSSRIEDAVGRLKKGEEIVVKGTTKVGGLLRLKYAGGWVSATDAKDGRVMVKKVLIEGQKP